jgi:hypothetical protein
MYRFPELPHVPENARARGPMSLRYEDVTQDGRLMLHALPHGIGEVMWAKTLSKAGLAGHLYHHGIVPILTRFVLQGLGGPIAVRKPLVGEGGYWLAHTVDAAGSVDRLLLNVFLDVFGEKGRTYGAQPDDAGARVRLGRVFAEHVFSRPFGPKDQRKVLRFDVPDLEPVPPTRHEWRAGVRLLDLPHDATPLEPSMRPDDAPLVFGLGHTDSNQHVNSLVYPWLFEQAALRRFAALGKDVRVLSRFCEIAYRKPCFSGDRVRVVLRAFASVGEPASLGAVGAFVPEGREGELDRAHAWIAMTFVS